MAIQIIFSRRLLELLYTNSHAMMKHRQSLPVPVQQSCSCKKNDNSEERKHSDSFFTARGNAQRVLISFYQCPDHQAGVVRFHPLTHRKL